MKTQHTDRPGRVRLALGNMYATPGALKALRRSGETALEYFARHMCGDWGEVDEADRAENELSLVHGFRVLSSYLTSAGEKLWVITEADRSATTILLPEEY